MRFSILAIAPILIAVVSANYYADCDDGKGNHEKYNEHIEHKQYSKCQKFNHGMENFNCYQDDGYSYKFEFYEDDNCGQKGGKKHEEKMENKKKNEKVKYYEAEPCYSYQVYCE